MFEVEGDDPMFLMDGERVDADEMLGLGEKVGPALVVAADGG